jgi:hypothetical protein
MSKMRAAKRKTGRIKRNRGRNDGARWVVKRKSEYCNVAGLMRRRFNKGKSANKMGMTSSKSNQGEAKRKIMP